MRAILKWLIDTRRNQAPQRKSGNTAFSNYVAISPDLPVNKAELNRTFSDMSDLIIREFTVKKSETQAMVAYLSGLTDRNGLNNNVLYPLMIEGTMDADPIQLVSLGNVKTAVTWNQVELSILSGESVLFVEGRQEAYLLETQGWPQRSIEDPQIETSVKGSHQGFVETGEQNIAMIRRYIQHREMKSKQMVVGTRGQSLVTLLYLADVIHPEVLQELEDRIAQVDIDAILNTGELAEFIEDNPYSPFPQFLTTERPDAAASQILQGRIAVVVDRSPGVLIGPATFISFMQSVDDYSTRWPIASFIRLLRFMAFFIAIFLPALYIASISYNIEIIPLKGILSVGEYRARVPFPPLLEALIMEITLELLREAGIRLPAPIGQTVGIVGGIVIGQTAVQAGFVSNMMVIVVALTAIASFIIPSFDMVAAIRLIRFPFMLAASMFGIIGIAVGAMTLIIHLIALESLGTPYGSPFAPMRYSDWKDFFIRVPIWKMVSRPKLTRAVQSRRQSINRPKGDPK
ncbi:spore germination protein [Paenibacillus filicis]|uniref:Spore germination protein n=1 Tax=Paenibacillus gyeongsangnamensis TaxID=3388067 RepID=A0ABT4Q761_9BACL|nr:spore germination protein [Paenibacillus filicis]MCZ8512712.1 spore germination protein [Paenibacillus filicis]